MLTQYFVYCKRNPYWKTLTLTLHWRCLNCFVSQMRKFSANKAGTASIIHWGSLPWEDEPDYNKDTSVLPTYLTRHHSMYGFSQWETTLHCNVVSDWLNPYSEWSLITERYRCEKMNSSVTQKLQVGDTSTSLENCSVITGNVTRASWHLRSPTTSLFVQPFAQAYIEENIKVPRHWPFMRGTTGDRRIPLTKGQRRENVSISWRHHAWP